MSAKNDYACFLQTTLGTYRASTTLRFGDGKVIMVFKTKTGGTIVPVAVKYCKSVQEDER
jgi:hypothetical protein